MGGDNNKNENSNWMEKYYSRIVISDEYRRGKFLIYDCYGGFYVCVIKKNFEYCGLKRKDVMKRRNFKLLPCAPLKEYKTSELCIKSQYEAQHRRKNMDVCRL